MKRNKCVYEYRLPESEGGHTYYVGQGNYNRPYKSHPYRGHKRNTCIKPKDKNQIVIIKDNLTEQEAKALEIELIDKHGRIDLGEGYLINKTDGGEGNNGWIASEETKRKMSEAQKGKILTEDHRRKLSKAHKGKILTEDHRRKLSESNKGKIITEETKRKISESRKGITPTEESRRKMSEAAKGRIITEDHRRKLSEAAKGKKRGSHTEETKRKMSEAYKNRPVVKCIHCGESSQNQGVITRWHNDNCKHKNAGKLPI
tara:strand:- start:1176 stop:1952 length:777 start_codon:yes stop_codon:yes gene_type:complete